MNSSRQERRELKVSVKNCVEKERKKGRGNDLKLSVINKRGERKDGTSREREKKRKKYDHSSENSREKGEGGISRGERASAIVRVKNRVKKKERKRKIRFRVNDRLNLSPRDVYYYKCDFLCK